MLFRNPVSIAAVGLLSLLAFEATYNYSRPLPSVLLRIEWLSWGLLFASSKIRLWYLQADSKGTGGGGSGSSHTSYRSIVLVLCIFIARALRWTADVSWVFPMITAATYLFARPALYSKYLPRFETSPEQHLTHVLPFKQYVGARTLRWAPTMASCFAALFSSVALIVAARPILTLSNTAASLCFMVVQTATLLLLSQEPERQSPPIHMDGESNTFNSRYLAQISGRLFALLTLNLALVPESFVVSKELFVLSALNAIYWLSIFVLCFMSSPISASALATFASCSIDSLLLSPSPTSFGLVLAAYFALAQVIIFLPLSTRHRGLLGVFFIVPLPFLFPVNRLSQWTSSLEGIHNYPTGPSGSVQPDKIFSGAIHPIAALAMAAQAQASVLQGRQSKTLEHAMFEYKRRYKRTPPPGFDVWFDEAVANNFTLTDEFDIMMAAFEPFWGVPPLDIQSRVESALASAPEYLIRGIIKNHQAHFDEPRSDKGWMGSEIMSWFSAKFLAILPDMVFAINGLDEPRVSVPNDTIEAALQATRGPLSKDRWQKSPESTGFNKIPVDFLKEGRQRDWQDIVLSCPVDSPARLENKQGKASFDGVDLGFILNNTSGTDVCYHSEFREQHGFFSSASTLELTHALVPIFSQGRPSTFQDLLYPSPYYPAKYSQHEYDDKEDIPWEDKENKLYWTGANTGGHTNQQNWRHFHRQRMYLFTHGGSSQPITLLNSSNFGTGPWSPYHTTMAAVSPLFDTRITAVIQCDEPSCEEQRKAFDCPEERKDPISQAYRYKFNLDLDGNAFSGRFYRLLLSRTVPVKQTVFIEWHDDWLIPWAHYVPISMAMTELPEVIRYLSTEEEGLKIAMDIAGAGAVWARQVLRKKDMELVFMRLLLEYARLINPERDSMECCT